MRTPPPSRRIALNVTALGVSLTAALSFVGPLPRALAGAGDLDPSFGPNGRVITSGVGVGQDTGNGVAVQPDGKVIVAGAVGLSTPTDEPHDVAVIRYREDGTRDPDFAGDGMFTMDVSGGQDFAYDVAVAGDGTVAVAGTTYRGGDPDLLVLRLTSSGDPDPTFGGGDGLVITPLSGLGDRARAVAVQPDGKIVVAGETAASGGAGDLFVARYTSSGDLDPSFSDDGVATMDVMGNGGADGARDLVLQADGRPVVVGSTTDGGRTLIAVARYTTGGQPDATFSADGRRTISFGPVSNVGRGVAMTPTGRIVVVGSRDLGSAATMVVAQLRRGGPLDDGFSGDGKRTISFGPGPETGSGVVVSADGSIVAGGSAASGASSDFALARLTSGGELDPSFGGGDGRILTDFSGRQDLCLALALDPQGRIVGTGGTRWGDSLPLEDIGTTRWRSA